MLAIGIISINYLVCTHDVFAVTRRFGAD